MKVLHVPYSYYPEPAGGTEVYVSALAKWQRAFGCEAAVAAPAAQDDRYEIETTPVWRFAVSPSATLRELYGEGDRTAALSFRGILDGFAPDILHLHAFTGAVSVLFAEEAARRSIPVVFNYHTPTVSCSRGTLLRWGTEPCDGDLESQPCVACTLQNYGVPRPVASLLSCIPVRVSGEARRFGESGKISTALRMPELVGVRNAAFLRMMQISERVVALCEWTRDLLLRNHVPAPKITLCRQGISWDTIPSRPHRPAGLPLRVAFLGRFDPTKGTHLIVEAIKKHPELPLQLDLFGVRQGDSGNRYAARVQQLMTGDKRVRMLPAIPPHKVVATLAGYDAVAVPSQWLETGPLVVLEAFAAGTPVIGSDLGGIAELVRDEIDGLLIRPACSSEAWAQCFSEICDRPDRLHHLRSGIRTPRHTRDVALQFMPLYAELSPQGSTTVCQ